MTSTHHSARRSGATVLGLAAGSLLALSACSSSTHSSAAGSSPTSSASKPAAGVTVSSADVTGYGTVLVDGSGRTLYMLSSEQGGKVTCTSANGCSTYWPPAELPAGVTAATAGSGVQASLLGTAKDPQGNLHVTYGGWPLYTYSGDSASGQANGEGVKSFGGTWYVLGVSGHPVTAKAQGTAPSSSRSGGYGY